MTNNDITKIVEIIKTFKNEEVTLESLVYKFGKMLKQDDPNFLQSKFERVIYK